MGLDGSATGGATGKVFWADGVAGAGVGAGAGCWALRPTAPATSTPTASAERPADFSLVRNMDVRPPLRSTSTGAGTVPAAAPAATSAAARTVAAASARGTGAAAPIGNTPGANP